MSSFKHPSFQDRVGQATAAKNKALEQLRLVHSPTKRRWLDARPLASDAVQPKLRSPLRRGVQPMLPRNCEPKRRPSPRRLFPPKPSERLSETPYAARKARR